MITPSESVIDWQRAIEQGICSALEAHELSQRVYLYACETWVINLCGASEALIRRAEDVVTWVFDMRGAHERTASSV